MNMPPPPPPSSPRPDRSVVAGSGPATAPEAAVGHARRLRPSRLLPRPLLSALLVIVWLLLVQRLGLADILAAIAVAVVVPYAVRRFLVDPVLPRRPALVLRFAATVLHDIVVANLVVARIVVSPASNPKPAWLTIDLALRDPHAITLLASVITLTPGTVSCAIDEATHRLYVHALDCADPEAMRRDIQQRYEKPLKEIFEWPPES